MTAWIADDGHGVLCEGPVGSARLGRFRLFRYEVRCWPGGGIPDVAEAVDSPWRARSGMEGWVELARLQS